MSVTDEVIEILNEDQNAITFEEISDENDSPLNQPVIEKDIARIPGEQNNQPTENVNTDETTSDSVKNTPDQKPDAPEQEINENYQETASDEEETELIEIPTSHAKQVAEAFLGMADNVIGVGGGYFIRIKKHKDFYDFDEIIQIIDEQNNRNVKRLKLDEEDKVLLRPLLVSVLKTKAKKLTPEQQLIGAVLSILMKKAQIFMEIRAENEILVERILEIIQEEKGQPKEESPDDPKEQTEQQDTSESTPTQNSKSNQTPTEDFVFDNDAMSESILESAEEPLKE